MLSSFSIRGVAVVAIALGLGSAANAAIQFNQNVTNNVIYGSGNANGSFTTDRNLGVELGLRAKVRFPAPANVFNSNGDGTYNQAAGGFGGSGDRASWNFDWSINSNFDGTSGFNLDDLSYSLWMDFDPTAGTNFQAFDPINLGAGNFLDHSIGDNTTAQGAGVEAADAATYASLIANNNLAQNSWQLNFFDSALFPFDPTVAGTYDFLLSASVPGGTAIASTSIQVIVGNGGAAVPEAATLAVWGGLAVCGGAFAWRKKAKAA